MDLRICRICCGVDRLKSISDQDSEIITKLSICVNINIHPGDLLPKQICEQCDKTLELSYRLRKLSEATQQRLNLELQRKQKGAVHDLNESKRNGFIEQLESEKFDLSQCSEYSSDSKSLKDSPKKIVFSNDGTIEHKLESQTLNFSSFDCEQKGSEIVINEDNLKDTKRTLQPQFVNIKNFEEQYLAETLEANDVTHEENNNINNSRNNIVINTSNDNSEISLKDTENLAIFSEYCSIDLLSSASSTNDCFDYLDNKQVKATITDTLTCDTCHEVFAKNDEYRIHIKQHGIERYQCIQCCKFFPSRFRLKRHEETHNEIPSHQCSYCNRNYRALYNLKRHMRSAHLGKKSWECNVCKISFSRLDVLKRHLQLHSDEKKFRCSMCSQSFKTKDYLRTHFKKTHTPNTEFSKTNKRTKRDNGNKSQCGYCGMLFKSAFAYKNHVLIHTNEKPHKCDFCNKSFRTIAALITHERIHNDYRPYQCDICLKSFKQTSHLKEHKSLHSSNIPKHICSVCQSAFAKKGNLKAHMRTHTKENPFKCADCSAEFSFLHLLKQHAKEIHCRSVHKVYTSNEIDEVLESNFVNSNNTLDSDMYLYIDTVSDDDCEIKSNDANVINVEDISVPQERPSSLDDKNYDVRNNERILDYGDMQSLIQSQSFEEEFIVQTDDEDHIKEQKVEVLVAEETKLTSSIYTVYKVE